MKNTVVATLLVVLMAGFMVGALAPESQAKVGECWDDCINGMEAKCCEIYRSSYVLVRCHILNPPTPCE